MKKYPQDEIGKIESVSTIIVNIGTIMSWLFAAVTAFALISQPQPIEPLGILKFNVWYKFLFLVSVFLGYIQLLRKSWENKKRRASRSSIEGNFGSFLYGSVVKLKRPLVLIGFLAT